MGLQSGVTLLVLRPNANMSMGTLRIGENAQHTPSPNEQRVQKGHVRPTINTRGVRVPVSRCAVCAPVYQCQRFPGLVSRLRQNEDTIDEDKGPAQGFKHLHEETSMASATSWQLCYGGMVAICDIRFATGGASDPVFRIRHKPTPYFHRLHPHSCSGSLDYSSI